MYDRFQGEGESFLPLHPSMSKSILNRVKSKCKLFSYDKSLFSEAHEATTFASDYNKILELISNDKIFNEK